jgi:hypothetical protein
MMCISSGRGVEERVQTGRTRQDGGAEAKLSQMGELADNSRQTLHSTISLRPRIANAKGVEMYSMTKALFGSPGPVSNIWSARSW